MAPEPSKPSSRPGLRPPPALAEWAYFIDVDGTLVELAEEPGAIRVDSRLPQLLEDLYRTCDRALALVSGRSLDDLGALFGGLPLPMAGQHGLELRTAAGPLATDGSPGPTHEAVGDIRNRLEARVLRHPGLLLEDKGLTLALHYRRAPQLAPYVHRLMREVVAGAGKGMCLQKGKRVLEIKPCGFDKGRAVETFMHQPPFRGRRPVFIGDDITDEHGFAAVNRRGGLSIKVGPGRTQARRWLPDVAAVHAWLAAIVRPGRRGESPV